MPAQIWAAMVATACMFVGWNWDISWHRSVGRDTVWTPAHIAIYIATFLAFAYNAALVIAHTLARETRGRGEARPALPVEGGREGSPPNRHAGAPAIRVLGFTGPSGAFVTLWSVLLQFAAILFDNWWHDIYGLDIAVATPPHYLLSFAISVFYFGQFILVALYYNRARAANSPSRGRLRAAVLVIWGIWIGHSLLRDPSFGPLGDRSLLFLGSNAVLIPFFLVAIQTFLESRWASTIASLVYFFTVVLMMQIFQLAPTEPRFGPVFVHVDHLLPPLFPLALFVPALAISAIVDRYGDRARLPLRQSWRVWLLVGAAYVVLFTGTNWLTSAFVTSDWADNRIFAGHDPGSAFQDRYRPTEKLGLNALTAALAFVSVPVGALSGFSGMFLGRWLRGVVR